MGLHIRETMLVEAVFQDAVSARDIQDWLDRIEQLIARQQPFFFLSTTHANTQLADDYRAIQAVWYKRHKPAFRSCCRGLVRIAQSAQEQARLDTPALHAAWGVPYFVTTDRGAGLQWITAQLKEPADECI